MSTDETTRLTAVAQQIVAYWRRTAERADRDDIRDLTGVLCDAFRSHPDNDVVEFETGGNIRLAGVLMSTRQGHVFVLAGNDDCVVYDPATLGDTAQKCYDNWWKLCGEDKWLVLAEAQYGVPAETPAPTQSMKR